jgi:predicted transcriptional regulator of viral defense system
MNINAAEIKKLEAYKKSYITVNDFRRIYGLAANEARVYLHRLTKSGSLVRIGRGIYRVFTRLDPIEKIAADLYYPSYLSFYYLLGLTGILNQKAYTISLATTKKSRRTILEGREVEYKQMKPELFFGYFVSRDGYYEAYPEKALLDQLYMVSRGKGSLDYEELNLIDLNKKRFKEYLKKFPKRVKKLAKEKILAKWGSVSVTI